MKTLRLDRWASQVHPPRNPRPIFVAQKCRFSTAQHRHRRSSSTSPRADVHHRADQHQSPYHRSQRRYISGRRRASSAAAAQVEDQQFVQNHQAAAKPDFPRHRRAVESAKLAALHARLSLPTKLPLQTLARCLIDPSVDPRQGYNNAPFAILGQELLGYYTSEHIMCHYPRLPMPILFAAQYAYVGPATLAAIRTEWGVETVAAPGREVDPGLLQLKRMIPGNALAEDGMHRLKDMPHAKRIGSSRKTEEWWRRGFSSRIVYDDEFGDLRSRPLVASSHTGSPVSRLAQNEAGGEAEIPETRKDGELEATAHADPVSTEPATVEAASAGFVRALAGAVYLHAGTQAAKNFHMAHILSRQLQLHTLFNFTHPTRDLSRLCAREGFEPPVARLISETGRLSRTPVFIVGVFSGNDKLGEGTGSSLNEGRVRAAAAALRSWYLYSPPDTEIVLPSEVEGAGEGKKAWKPQMVDVGEVVT